MLTLKFFSRDFFIYISLFILVVLLLSFYNMIIPEKTVQYNFDPFPRETPSSLPDPAGKLDGCWNTLTACDSSGECSACDISKYECKNVTKDGMYSFNGINVPKGKWCLRKDDNPNPQCNSVTGRWIWSFDPDYCGNLGLGTQCWKCHCLYPNLFTGAETGCTTQIACQNDSIRSQSIGELQSGNILQPTECAPESIKGCTWSPDNNDQRCANLKELTPYDSDENGNPLFTCSCGDRKTSQFFASLPGDPYNCHLEPCSKYMNSTMSSLTCTKNNCGNSQDCSCSCPQNFAKSPSGDFQDTCVLISSSCGQFGYDSDSQKCTCGEGLYWERTCRSELTGVNQDKPYLPICKYPENALGSECYNPCEEMDECQHNAPCISCGPTSYLTIPECNLDPNTWSILSETEAQKIHAFCNCSAGDKPKDYGGYYGPTCSMQCLGDGARLYTSELGEGHGGDCTRNCCCSMRTKTVSRFLGDLSTKEVCDGDWPSKDNPPVNQPFREGCSSECHAGG